MNIVDRTCILLYCGYWTLNIYYYYYYYYYYLIQLSQYVLHVFKPKAYKLYLPIDFIGSDALKFMKEFKYLDFTFSESYRKVIIVICYEKMRLLYVKFNKLLRTISHRLTDVKNSLFQSDCTATLFCPYLWNDYQKSTYLAKFVLHLMMLTEKYVV